ncbi:hypothetical protein [Desulfobacter vibrioformis]|uniref:hypothetical protein n=1 Tax=Desulfobacter vibrioformis TaxID=34031 RepID=UPI0005562656|nr:hypothetical protein [Desulfobacter vibrioformis]
MSEHLIWLGQKQEKDLAARQLNLSIIGLRDSLRILLNPHIDPVEIDPVLVQHQSFELADKVVRYKELKAEIKNIDRSLGPI